MIINGIKETDRVKICNAFGNYYSEIGKNIAENIERNANAGVTLSRS